MASLSKRRFDQIQHPHSHSPALKHARPSTPAQDQEANFPPWEEMFSEPLPFPSLMFDNVESKEQAQLDFTVPPSHDYNLHDSIDSDPQIIELRESMDACGLFTFPEDVDTPYDENIKPVIDTLEELEACTHETSLQLKQAIHDDKGTAVAYQRHFGNYATFLGQAHRTLSAIPITATKVSLFLAMERERPKRTHNGLDIPGTRVGFEHLKQCVSALEYHRFNHKHEPCYKADPASQVPLRDDTRIKTFEKVAKANWPNVIADSHSRKAAGTSADTYTPQQLSKASVSFFNKANTPSRLMLSARDQAMLITLTCTAFRGDNIWTALLSNMFPRTLPVPELGPDATVEVMLWFFLLIKANQIPPGDLTNMLHIMKKLHPNFVPDHSDLAFGEFGYRSWYQSYLFPSSEGDDVQMSYKNHHARVKKMHKENDIAISKATHAGQGYAAHTARQHGATKESVKAIGWSAGDSFSACYDQALPLDALMGAAMFNGRNFASYFIARAALGNCF
ncbi:hypothetical protein BDP27DRAFT_1371825 [Rhodocollybia butyracea]|uniref:Uncharacterized protein n=1 Tax=Rhodocollybia butyracea TaxID=206335 RepID=A0A9P5P912_9AGAR|nr:hypothetical protein BDP27DRAFT_1371825 [Rhodocollybia butyracea]